jgi:hypothetical protein
MKPLWEGNQRGDIHKVKCQLGHIQGQVKACHIVSDDLKVQMASSTKVVSTDKTM